MIQVSFTFEVRILPMLAVEIEKEKSINGHLMNHNHIDHSIDALISIEYRGRGSVWFDIPVILPIELINHIIHVVFSEFQQRQLIPGTT